MKRDGSRYCPTHTSLERLVRQVFRNCIQISLLAKCIMSGNIPVFLVCHSHELPQPIILTLIGCVQNSSSSKLIILNILNIKKLFLLISLFYGEIIQNKITLF